MPKNSPPKISGRFLRPILLPLVLATALLASEHHGVVLFGGLPVPGATVIATQGSPSQEPKKLTAITSDVGAYSFPDLSDGPWTLEVQMLAFEPLKKEITVAPDSPADQWDLKALPIPESAKPMAPAPTTATSTLAGPAPAPGPASKGGFRKAEVKASPEGSQMAAEPPAPAGDANQTATDAFAINGSVNNGAASAFGQSAAFGNARGSGFGLIHGGIGIIEDNSYLDARPYSLTGQDTPKAAYNHLTVTGNLGGLLKIPHLITSNNWNFFLGYQLMLNRNASTQAGLMPTAAEREGDFSQANITPIDPTTGAPFPNGIIPASRISPQAKALIALYPLPNFNSNSGYNFQIPLVGSVHQNSINSRINKSINQRNQVYGTFAWQGGATVTPNLFGFNDTGNTTGYNAVANYSHRFGSRVFSHFQYQFSRYSSLTTPYFANKQNISGDAGIGGNLQSPLYWGPPALSFSSGIAGLTDSNYSSIHNQTGAFGYDTYWSHRSHNVTFGADYKRQEFNTLSQQNPRGSFSFTGAATGNDFADFLLGTPDASSIAYGNADKYFRSSLYDAYFTDDWRLRSGITLNIGGRWEYNAPITELYGRLVNLDIAPGYSAVAPVVASNPIGPLTRIDYPSSLVRPDKRLVQPRIGASWRPFPDSSMVIRAGLGMYENTSVYQSIASQMAQQSPLSKSLSVQNSAADPLTLANGFNASPLTTVNTFAIDPNFRVGYAYNWQLSIQRDLPGSLVFIATYLGIKGTRAVQEFLPNTYPTGATNPCPLCPAGFIYMTSNGNSTRESGSLQLRRRLHNGFTATATYTYSKSIDDASLGGRGQGGAVIAQNWLDLSAERGLSNFDQRQLLNANLQYSSGTGLRGGTLMGGWRGALLKEWTMIVQITAGSGLPETPIYSTALVAGTGVGGSIRPNYDGANVYAAKPGLYLNAAAFTAPTPGQWGNAGRNSITGPDQFSTGASFARTFRLTGKLNSDLRFDVTNPLNHVTYTSWNASAASSQFGLPVAANAMRSMVVTLRVRF
jgi:hypothetical protein